ncbi:MAG: lamin tail domain-containing protein [Phycisphaeraceae bacterium]|nr:lamin tail domain-containing protein [Phycisphaerae bacterium]MBX3393297.1 lamin tail domain-containing protein [Phycisphaeraceae bacterium]
MPLALAVLAVAIAPPLPYPHPVITEVLYAVPTRGGDANRDGVRDASTDEFVELVNPHGRPINLKGYTITDSGEGKSKFKFTFPPVEVLPGQVVVVFNGGGPRMPGPVGDAKNAPPRGHPDFHGALVFNARTSSSRASFANKSDYALLLAPTGAPIACVHWGGEKTPPAHCLLLEEAPAISRGSVQRATHLAIDPVAPTTTSPLEESIEHDETDASESTRTRQPRTPPRPDTPDDASRRETRPALPAYKRREPRSAPASNSAPNPPPAMTFAEFIPHPPLPASLFGRSGNSQDGAVILFSPGLYPLDAALRPSREANEEAGNSEPSAGSPDPAGGPPRQPPPSRRGPSEPERPRPAR